MSRLGQRFWSKVAVAPALDCWPWLASLNTGGYGQFMLDGRPQRAHRLAYEELRAEIPAGLQLDHLCRNRRCVNPWHLEPVTNAVNTARGMLPLINGERQRSKTHCANGHPYNADNTRLDPKWHRRCRACERAQSLAGYYRRKANAAA